MDDVSLEMRDSRGEVNDERVGGMLSWMFAKDSGSAH